MSKWKRVWIMVISIYNVLPSPHVVNTSELHCSSNPKLFDARKIYRCTEKAYEVSWNKQCTYVHQKKHLQRTFKIWIWVTIAKEIGIDWINGAIAPHSVLALLYCKCNRKCILPHCTCLFNGLKCYEMCTKKNCHNQPSDDLEPPYIITMIYVYW